MYAYVLLSVQGRVCILRYISLGRCWRGGRILALMSINCSLAVVASALCFGTCRCGQGRILLRILAVSRHSIIADRTLAVAILCSHGYGQIIALVVVMSAISVNSFATLYTTACLIRSMLFRWCLNGRSDVFQACYSKLMAGFTHGCLNLVFERIRVRNLKFHS